jgi:hypothetical protein
LSAGTALHAPKETLGGLDQKVGCGGFGSSRFGGL